MIFRHAEFHHEFFVKLEVVVVTVNWNEELFIDFAVKPFDVFFVPVSGCVYEVFTWSTITDDFDTLA